MTLPLQTALAPACTTLNDQNTTRAQGAGAGAALGAGLGALIGDDPEDILIGAAVGGTYFVVKSAELVRAPGPKAAMANFKASFVQLGFLLLGAILDGTVKL